MRRIVTTGLMVLVTMVCFAQETKMAQDTLVAQQTPALKFGYLSYEAVMHAMPDYAKMQEDMAQLQKHYEAEMTRVENDFNIKYEEFLDGQASFPKTILQKRQSELQEMLDKNIAFKKESQQMLKKAKDDAVKDLYKVIDAAVETIAQKRGMALVIDTDKESVTFINPIMGEDITEDVKAILVR